MLLFKHNGFPINELHLFISWWLISFHISLSWFSLPSFSFKILSLLFLLWKFCSSLVYFSNIFAFLCTGRTWTSVATTTATTTMVKTLTRQKEQTNLKRHECERNTENIILIWKAHMYFISTSTHKNPILYWAHLFALRVSRCAREW